MLEDKFINYISPVKSPFEEDDLTQEDLGFDGYMQYQRDCMIKSIGTSESSTQFDSYWDEFTNNCTQIQKDQFISNCINRIIKHYKMSYLSCMLSENEYSEKTKIDLIFFYAYKRWLKYYPKCLSFINEKILSNQSMLKIFITSDYDNFMSKIDTCKSCNELILNYYKYCSKNDGIETLILTLKDDILQNYIYQKVQVEKLRKTINAKNY